MHSINIGSVAFSFLFPVQKTLLSLHGVTEVSFTFPNAFPIIFLERAYISTKYIRYVYSYQYITHIYINLNYPFFPCYSFPSGPYV